VYTIPAWSLNAIYSRFRPHGAFKTVLFSSLLDVLRMAEHLFYQFCKWSTRNPIANAERLTIRVGTPRS
jgi:hypothetical protein